MVATIRSIICSATARASPPVESQAPNGAGRVQTTSMKVLWLQRAGVGLARLLKRIITISSRISTNTAMPVVIGSSSQSWNQICSSRSGLERTRNQR